MGCISRLYGELAPWWRLLSPPTDYREEVPVYLGWIAGALGREPATLLELGSGGGHLASQYSGDAEWVLTDVAPAMVASSAQLNPDREHHVGDMRTLRLDRTFDAVLVHDATSYIVGEADLNRTLATVHAHLAPGGAALLVPDRTVETFEPGVDSGGSEQGERSAHYLERVHRLDPQRGSCRVEFVFLLREGDTCRVEHDVHECGVFPRATWLGRLHAAGFEARAIPLPGSLGAPAGAEAFLAVRR